LFQVVSYTSIFVVFNERSREACLDAAGRITVKTSKGMGISLADGRFKERCLTFFLKGETG
jgi:hypothetical protein